MITVDRYKDVDICKEGRDYVVRYCGNNVYHSTVADAKMFIDTVVCPTRKTMRFER